jgi:hypothetical protein
MNKERDTTKLRKHHRRRKLGKEKGETEIKKEKRLNKEKDRQK